MFIYNFLAIWRGGNVKYWCKKKTFHFEITFSGKIHQSNFKENWKLLSIIYFKLKPNRLEPHVNKLQTYNYATGVQGCVNSSFCCNFNVGYLLNEKYHNFLFFHSSVFSGTECYLKTIFYLFWSSKSSKIFYSKQ